MQNTVLFASILMSLSATAGTPGGTFCPEVYPQRVIELPFNPAFLHIQSFDTAEGGRRDGLLMSSFYNAIKNREGTQFEKLFERDLVAYIADLDAGVIDTERESARDASGSTAPEVEILTDLDGVARQVWPNETARLPDGMVPFEALIAPQGFQSALPPGRLSLINLDDPQRREYLVDQSSFIPPRCAPGSADNQPWFYHGAVFIDMDEDGLLDIVTARASFKVRGGMCPPTGQLVWFRNPGKALQPDKEWQAFVLVDTRPAPGGPEVNIAAADMDGDGRIEIIATHFFKYDGMTIYGAPEGGKWADVDPAKGPFVRQHDIMRGQGNPFAVEIADLNLDGRLDVLTSNHQPDNCFAVTKSDIAGRVIAIEQPDSGDIFERPWTVHVLKDGIRPNPTFPAPERGPGRLAPNRAVAFWPARVLEGNTRPWLLVGGDEASKVWILKPRFPLDTNRWEYDSAVIFDINDHYGPNTTQTLLDDPQGISISTIGGLTWRYDRPGPLGLAEIYFPVFEAQDIHVLSFRPTGAERISCPPDVTVSCPVN
jgi:hypothetical protein